MIRLLHLADVHLDSPFKGLSQARELPEVFRQATFTAFERALSCAIARKADAVLLAGDLFDQRDQSLRARLALREQLERLDAHGIASFIAHGNHDPLDANPLGLKLPASVRTFGPEVEEHLVESRCGAAFRVQGISFAKSEVLENLSLKFARRGPEPTVGVLHANLHSRAGSFGVGGTSQHYDYAPCTREDLERADLDYWALGHVHLHDSWPLGAHALAAYPGNTQTRHMQERGDKGCLWVELDPKRSARPTLEVVPTQAVRFSTVRLDVAQAGSTDALLDLALESCAALPPAVGLLGEVVRVVLEGFGPLHGALQKAEERSELSRSIYERLLSRPVPTLLESLRFETRPELDVEAVRAAGGLAGELALACSEPVSASELDLDWLNQLDQVLKQHQLPRLGDRLSEWVPLGARAALELLQSEEE